MKVSSALVFLVSATIANAAQLVPAHKITLVNGIAGSNSRRNVQDHHDHCSTAAALCIKHSEELNDVHLIRKCVKEANICEMKRCPAYKACAQPCGKNSECIVSKKCIDQLQLC
ncbi:hypothetical protein HDU79_006618 [Rhizoclosmatium sp. JEL0117]|nr:hypothetical protein HDU79_006618 [Rhizoclosmatium sp. JEL0117]